MGLPLTSVNDILNSLPSVNSLLLATDIILFIVYFFKKLLIRVLIMVYSWVRDSGVKEKRKK